MLLCSAEQSDAYVVTKPIQVVFQFEKQMVPSRSYIPKGLLPYQKQLTDIDAIDEEAALTSQRCDKIVACRSSLSGMFYATILAMLGLMFLMFSIYNSNGKFFYSGSSSPGSTGLEWHQHVPMVP